MDNFIVLISKDAFCREYLPAYGNRFWAGKTPNIDELAEKGTVFTSYYTAAPSSAMAYLSMFTGEYAHETEIETFKPVQRQYQGDTLFDKANALGYETHIIWDTAWMDAAKVYSECYGRNTTFHSIDNLRQGVGAHYIHKGFLRPNVELSQKTMQKLKNELEIILSNGEKIFLWIHLPHVLNGSVSYGSDVDVYDHFVGIVRKYVGDERIFITSDHGNMNGRKGKLCYGFDVYDPAIRIPLITPRKEALPVCDRNISSVDLCDILFSKKIPKERKFIYSDSAYYVQEHRKLAIIHGKYKYIYNNKTGLEELYDTDYDPEEKFSIMKDFMFDEDRKITTPARELYFYPEWDKLPEIRKMLHEERVHVWRNPSLKQKFLNFAKDKLRVAYAKIHRVKM